MVVTILAGLVLVLWVLGGVMAADVFPQIEYIIERKLYTSEKLKLFFGWPILAVAALLDKETASEQ